jgi:GT2 family glycosyltransferase
MSQTRVSVQIVTFNSESDIAGCLESLSGQTYRNFRVRILDNASSDRTLEHVGEFEADVIDSDVNIGFGAGHNRLARSWPAPYVLFLNPDTVLEPTFLEEIVSALEEAPDAGSASGKLLRMDGQTIDSAGIIMTRNQRHLDRGAGEADRGQYDEAGPVFGPSGAAALYRYACLEDVAIGSWFFDEDFFAYREDADLAWRCRLLGWGSIYVPSALARHRRRVTPERRSELSEAINRHSVKNRFLLRLNNMTWSLYLRDLWLITARDLQVVGYVLFQENSSLPGLLYPLRHLSRLLEKRRIIQSRVRIDSGELERWFG